MSSANREFLNRILRALGVAAVVYAMALGMISLLPQFEDSDQSTSQPSISNDHNSSTELKKAAERFESLRLDGLRAPLTRVPQRKVEVPIQSYGYWFNRDEILKDYDNRISDSFDISEDLSQRVGFWFDIYSRYDYHKRVIHHRKYPWVIFKVVDVEPIISATYPRLRWMRNQVADDLVKKEVAAVRKALDSLAKKRNSELDSEKLTATELDVKLALELLTNRPRNKKLDNLYAGKDVRRLAREARHAVRVQMGQRNFFAEGLQIAPRYMAEMEQIFIENRLPVELTRLPLVESSFNKHAKSKVGAAGIWQFMENTGRKKKLVIDSYVDERKSPFKATAAAARLLKENHMILGRSWELAVTAWNHGPGGVKLAMRASQSKDLARIIQRYDSRRFSFASENFYAEFLAALYTEKYSDLIFQGLPKMAPLDIQEIRLTRKMQLLDVVSVIDSSVEDFLAINPDLERLVKAKRPLHKGLRIMVPTEMRRAVELEMADKAGGENRRRLIGAND